MPNVTNRQSGSQATLCRPKYSLVDTRNDTTSLLTEVLINWQPRVTYKQQCIVLQPFQKSVDPGKPSHCSSLITGNQRLVLKHPRSYIYLYKGREIRTSSHHNRSNFKVLSCLQLNYLVRLWFLQSIPLWPMNGTEIDCSLPQHFPNGTEKKTITIIFHTSKRNPPDQVTLISCSISRTRITHNLNK